jgi:hypothetical protein
MSVAMRRLLLPALLTVPLASCVPPAAPPRPAPPPVAPSPAALPAAPPQQDWRDVPLTAGRWAWQGTPGTLSISRFGLPGATVFTIRCDFASRAVLLAAAASDASAMTLTTSFGAITLSASSGTAQLGARDARLDQIAFSRGRFLVDMAGQPRLVLPAWPEVARVVEDCRG